MYEFSYRLQVTESTLRILPHQSTHIQSLGLVEIGKQGFLVITAIIAQGETDRQTLLFCPCQTGSIFNFPYYSKEVTISLFSFVFVCVCTCMSVWVHLCVPVYGDQKRSSVLSLRCFLFVGGNRFSHWPGTSPSRLGGKLPGIHLSLHPILSSLGLQVHTAMSRFLMCVLRI